MSISLMFAFFIGLFALYTLFIRSKSATLIFFFVLPLVLPVWWLQNTTHPWFTWLKLYSVVLGVCWLMLLRYRSLRQKTYAFQVLRAFYWLNIFEAMVMDVVAGSWLNYANAISAALLLVTMPRADKMSIEYDTFTPNLKWDISYVWILAYSFWNLAFVHMFASHYTVIHVAVLGSALLISLINRKLWAQARAITLGVYFILFFTFSRSAFVLLQNPEFVNEPLAMLLLVSALILMIAHCVQICLNRRQTVVENQITRV